MNSIKDQFPIFKNIPDLVFLDNASTTQKPLSVINKLNEVYTQYNSNVHRGLYPIAEKVNQEYENAREIIAKFINAEKEEIIFTSGTTEATNFIAQSLISSGIISSQPRVLTTELEHHASFLPWQRVSKENLEYAKVNADRLDFDREKVFDIVAYSIVSNVTGQFTDIKTLKKDKLKNAIFIADAAQAIAHMPINVKEMNVDFMVFSGHKMFGPTGVGVVYGKKELLQRMEPFKVGGGMIDKVEKDHSTWAISPQKFEAGTPPIADAIALGAATEFIQTLGFENILKIENSLRKYALERLSNIPNIKIYHSDQETAGPVISFTIKGLHPHDIAQFLGENNICVRAGHHCTQILHREVFEIPASVRISLCSYNNEEDINKLVENLLKCVNYYTSFNSNL